MGYRKSFNAKERSNVNLMCKGMGITIVRRGV